MFHLPTWTLFGVLLAAVLPYSEAIKCWDCNSKINNGCGDPFKPDDFAMADCSQKHLPRFPDKEGHICRKIIQKIEDEIRVIRGCGYINETYDTIPPGAVLEKQCMRRTGTYSVMMEYCSCNTGDGCNGASAVTALANAFFFTFYLPFFVWMQMPPRD